MNGGVFRSLLPKHFNCARPSIRQIQSCTRFRSCVQSTAFSHNKPVLLQLPRQTCRTFTASATNMTTLKTGDSFPEGVVFSYVPWSPETESATACGIPINFDASKEFADKKVVLFAVPGAFTPGCSVRHLPGYIENLENIKGKNVDLVCVIASNDAFVMSAWGKVNGIKDEILFLSDTDIKFSKSIGFEHTSGQMRTARYAMIIDHGKVVYAEVEPGRDVTVSSALAVLAKL